MDPTFGPLSLVSAAILLLAILACLELGRRIGRWHYAKDETERGGTAVVEGAVFGFMGLLLAFSFSGAMDRWEVRRGLVVEETNRIGTAWLRIDLLPSESQPPLRELFRSYTDTRLAVYGKLPDVAAARAELERANAMQQEIWSYTVSACLRADGEKARVLLLPAVNDMIDITTNRTMALLTHPPEFIYVMLVGLVLVSSVIAGFAMSPSPTRRWLHWISFAVAMAGALYVVLDLEFPRAGLFRIDAFDQFLIDLRKSMK